jgi:hypothetical protein
MGKHAVFITVAGLLLALAAAGCGLIGGPFDEPSPEEDWTATPTATPAPDLTRTAIRTPANPLPGGETPTPSPEPVTFLPKDCVDASAITFLNAGTKMCVGGNVYLAWQNHGTYYVDFSKEKGGFYMIGYNWVSQFVIRPGDCVYAQGKVVMLNQVPVMGIDPYTLKRCPVEGAK